VIGDADRCDAAIHLHPFVLFGISEIGGVHAGSLCEACFRAATS
jgi:hypothetical protein